MKPFDYQQSLVCMRDSFMPFAEANVSIASSPVLYGLAVYTVFNVRYDNVHKKLHIFRLKDHYERLCNSAQVMYFTPFQDIMDFVTFENKMLQLLKINHVKQDVLVRASLFIDELIAGTKTHGLKTSFSAYIYPMTQFYPKAGVDVCVSSWQRTPDNAIPSHAKVNGSYVNATLMKNEALLNGYDEAISLDAAGHVTEGTVANLFIVRAGVLITPDQSADILEGITRDSVMELAKTLGIPVKERPVDRSELYIADELFYTGSSARITPILSVDHRRIGAAKNGVMTQIAKAYDDVQLGKFPGYAKWLTTTSVL